MENSNGLESFLLVHENIRDDHIDGPLTAVVDTLTTVTSFDDVIALLLQELS